MTETTVAQPDAWVASLKGFLGIERKPVEHCELCYAEIEPGHDHLIEPDTRRLLCACQACALLFDSPEARRYRRVPREVTRLEHFNLSDAQWDALLIPINLAFFVRSSTQDRVLALYPGPAGATESTLALQTWDELAAANPLLKALQPDVEALLANRMDGAREYYRLPIDRCYELVGLIRSHWHGLSGGQDVRAAQLRYFEQLRAETSAGGQDDA
ncbi:DUF5947 family protein [Pseudomonas fluorescens]|uniref:Uncharacterized protein n=1 Tax=Pseudomonas fluorescens TaxID=294 RepID=A0A5E7AWC7_PSEFL|nr:DUF5947 family protein [Pseudomonas fluorescens]VVN81004.1 hypothetical protein PS723_01089 [Pseudomonas fluorescens]